MLFLFSYSSEIDPNHQQTSKPAGMQPNQPQNPINPATPVSLKQMINQNHHHNHFGLVYTRILFGFTHGYLFVSVNPFFAGKHYKQTLPVKLGLNIRLNKQKKGTQKKIL